MRQKLEAARALALGLMARFGLAEWQFAFNKRKRRMGQCVYPHLGQPGRIELSVYFVLLNDWSEIEDTIRHEISHALAGPKAGHGHTWRCMCHITGARPQACSDMPMPKGRWRAQCPNCGKEFNRFRRPKHNVGWHCVACGPDRGSVTWALTKGDRTADSPA
jgi:predicted SprT family Zn-dependent metalloprotease